MLEPMTKDEARRSTEPKAPWWYEDRVDPQFYGIYGGDNLDGSGWLADGDNRPIAFPSRGMAMAFLAGRKPRGQRYAGLAVARFNDDGTPGFSDE
jgi:hypothetical protein